MARGTRARILDAALRRFARQGFDGTTVTDIEDDAGLAAGSGSFYRHFNSKEAVFEAVVEREIERSAEPSGGPLSGPQPSADPSPSPATPDRAPGLTGDWSLGGPEMDARIALTLDITRVLDGLSRLDPLIAILARERDRFPALTARIQEAMLERGLELSSDRLASLSGLGPAASNHPQAVAPVVMSAMVGYHLASRFFGAAPGDLGRERFVATLVDLLAPPPPERPPS